MSAIDEGLAGVINTDVGYKKIKFSPKFPVTDYTELRYATGYEKTDTTIDLKYILTEKGMRYDITSPAKEMDLHILLPKGKDAGALYINGQKTDFKAEKIGDSLYVNAMIEPTEVTKIEIIF